MSAVMEGVRVLEVAEHTFVPAASALLSDWGAEVIKIEHVERGDAMRGLASTGLAVVPKRRPRPPRALQPRQEEPGPRPDHAGRARDPLQAGRHLGRLPHQQAPERPPEAARRRRGRPGPQSRHHLRTRDRPGRTRARCRQGLLRLAGVLGPCRGGGRRPGDPSTSSCPCPPAPGFGDSIGAMTIAGGIMGALFHRERTGEATTVDVSLLGVGPVGDGSGARRSRSSSTSRGRLRRRTPLGRIRCRAPTRPPTVARSGSPACRPASTGRPSARPSAGPSWPPIPGSPTTHSLLANSTEAIRELDTVFAGATLEEWRRATGRLRRPVGRHAGHASRRPPTPRPSPTATSRTAETAAGVPLPAGGRPGTVRRGARRSRPRPGPQRARRQHPRRARVRLGRHRGPQGPRRRRLTPITPTSRKEMDHDPV